MGKFSWPRRERGHGRALAFLLLLAVARGREGGILVFSVQLSVAWDILWTPSISPSTSVTSCGREHREDGEKKCG